jgi:hypothetical protein
MKNKKSNINHPPDIKEKKQKLTYPPQEDIYSRERKEDNLNPDDNTIITEENDEDDVMNEKGFKDNHSGSDLDVPGSELDDAEEANGNEDEENNYYSLPDNK